MEKKESLRILKDWADNNFIMVQDRSWTDRAYFPIPGKSVGSLVGIIAGRMDFYFDDNEFVDGDKTIIVVVPEKTTTGQFFQRLQELGLI
jgi:hypothetical protein